MASIISKYFNWLQKDAPAGEVERYPEINENGETSVKGIYIVGDLTGIPLLKLAAESGKKVISTILNDQDFQKHKSSNKDDEIYDLVIIGAGPAGIAPRNAGIKSIPVMRFAESTPAALRVVGARSTPLTSASLTDPGSTFPGQRISSGARNPRL